MSPLSTLEFSASDLAPERMDDATRRYIAEAQIAFDDLREIASQLAALLVLAGTADRAADIDHPMLAVAIQRWSATRERVNALTPSSFTAHHYRHLLRGVELYGDVFDAMQKAGILVGRIGSPLAILKAAWREMVHTSNALPGFYTVDLQQACCACHAPSRIRLAGH